MVDVLACSGAMTESIGFFFEGEKEEVEVETTSQNFSSLISLHTVFHVDVVLLSGSQSLEEVFGPLAVFGCPRRGSFGRGSFGGFVFVGGVRSGSGSGNAECCAAPMLCARRLWEQQQLAGEQSSPGKRSTSERCSAHRESA